MLQHSSTRSHTHFLSFADNGLKLQRVMSDSDTLCGPPPCFTRESNTGVFVLPPPSVKIHHRLTWQPTAGLCQSSSCTLCFKPEAQTSTVYTEHPASSSNINTWAKTKYLLSLKTETVYMIYFLLLFFLGRSRIYRVGSRRRKTKAGRNTLMYVKFYLFFHR